MSDAATVRARNDALLTWYETDRRDLPWRGRPDPYVTLVSEAMLQQTQVDRVIPKFEAFMERWPTVGDLATADPADVLAAWSGLGYNARALRLLDAARVVAEIGWPTTVEGLAELPGVGPYTAAAIASIAWGQAVPAVDTNLRRVLSRWEGTPLSGAELDTLATAHIASPGGDWNQALMDLGATLCRPRSPRCGECPVAEWCADPTVYEPPPRQSPFTGSNRELRGALVRAHLAGDDLLATGRTLDRSPEEIDRTIATLRDEGLLP